MGYHLRKWTIFFGMWVVSMTLRLFPFRFPHVEPVLMFQMPVGRLYGFLSGFIFSCSSMIFFDFITGHVGIWTPITAVVYGIVGSSVTVFMMETREQLSESGRQHATGGNCMHVKTREHKRAVRYGLCALVATLLYDVLTGLIMGPLLFQQSFVEACVGQIPFTLMHSVSNVMCVYFVSLPLERMIKYFIVHGENNHGSERSIEGVDYVG